MKKLKKNALYFWLGKEAGIEYKACMYFFVILFYYCCLLLTQHIYSARILHMTEMILATYAIGYIQLYFMRNFDESDTLGVYELVCTIISTGVYTALCWFLDWSMHDLIATVIFALYIFIAFISANIINRIKRDYDTKQLNDLLDNYKHNGGSHDK